MSDGVPIPTAVDPGSAAGRSKVKFDRHPRLGGPVFNERHVRVAVIGAGASGLCFAYKLQRSFENYTLTVYEKNEEVSGTWWENKYPGYAFALRPPEWSSTNIFRCACDVPAHNYTWSFEPKKDFTAVYASAPELFKYFHDFGMKYDLYKFFKCNHQVVGATWNGDAWDLEIEDRKNNKVIKDQADILINASGILNAWRWPAIPGIHDYKGALLHSANWDHKVSLEGKTVGLIGNG